MKKEIICPKCESNKVEKKISCGGSCIYARLVCKKCGFQGGRVQVIENSDWEKELKNRFKINSRDAVREFISTI